MANVSVKCDIVDIVKDLTSKYVYGIEACDYDRSLDKFLELESGKLTFCPKDCDNLRTISCSTPTNLILSVNNILSWNDVTGLFPQEYSLSYTNVSTGEELILDTTDIVEIYSGGYQLDLSNITFGRNTIYTFKLSRICEEDLTSSFAEGCAADLTIPNMGTIIETFNNGYAVDIEFGDPTRLPGTIEILLYQDETLLDTYSGPFIEETTYTGLTPGLVYRLVFKYYSGETQSCELKEYIFETNPNDYIYYTASITECFNGDCFDVLPTTYVYTTATNSLETGLVYEGENGLLYKIITQVLEEHMEATEIISLDTINCIEYCTCNEASGVDVVSPRILLSEVCEEPKILETDCKNCI